ncbi:MAG: hypothetical protein KR126chlam6_00881 [Candidatus Anoxychlamydiales bacterium]|nr:hypothetical protein [Candidatus Anoxychlamydiales bacterium]
MKILKRSIWIVPIIILSIFFLYGRKHGVDDCLKEPEEIEEDICMPCEESEQKAYKQGYAICENDLPKAYNAPARIDLCSNVDAYLTGSFIYFEVILDQIDLGITHFNTVTPNEFEIVKFSTSYEPGFKIGAGSHLPFDDWDLYAQYTRLHDTQNTIYDPNGKLGIFYTSWFITGSTNPNGYNLSEINSNIRAFLTFDFDKIDFEIARSFYVGKSLTLRPFIGGGGHFFDQIYGLDFTYQSSLREMAIKNHSWAIGPRFGISSNWFFYKCFRLFGYGAASLLFAENKISGSGNETGLPFSVLKGEKDILRDVEEFMLGLSWGSYFTNDTWHFDLSVAYEAQRYSNTNYMSKTAQMLNVDSNGDISSNLVNPGSTFLHGLTVTARFDF